MQNYKLNEVKWFFYRDRDFGTPEYNLTPYIEDKDDFNRIILLENGDYRYKDIGKAYIDYRVNIVDYSQTEVLDSAKLYSIYLLSKTKFLLNAFEKKFVGNVNDKDYVKISQLRCYLKAMVYSKEEVLALGKKFKKAYVKYLKHQEKLENSSDKEK